MNTDETRIKSEELISTLASVLIRVSSVFIRGHSSSLSSDRRSTKMAGAATHIRKEIAMRGLLTAGGLAALVLAAGGWSRPAAAGDDKTYDLRGPAPKKDQVFVSKMTLKIKDADTTLKVMGQTIKLK